MKEKKVERERGNEIAGICFRVNISIKHERERERETEKDREGQRRVGE